MQEKNAANPTPVNGTMNLLNGASSQTQVFAYTSRMSFDAAKQPRKVLVVEDDASLAHLEADYLTAHGYAVMIAVNGELAIAALSQSIPDLVVLDLELPGTLNGWDVLQAVRQQATIPVLLTTSAETAMRKYRRTGGETKLTLDHLPKPYPMQALLKCIERMLVIEPQ
jgi:twitching motility two-component system response regulator PilH